MNKIRKQIGIFCIGILMMFSSTQQVWAGEVSQAPALVDEEAKNKVKDSVVQVVAEYVDAQGTPYILKSGSGFLINEGAVLTSYDMLSLNDEEKTAAEGYLGAVLGKPVSFSEAEGTEHISYQIGVVMYRDVIVGAEVNSYSSKEMNLGILNLSAPLNRSTAVLGNSDTIGTGDEICAFGYKNVSVMQAEKKTELLSQEDIKVTEGTLEGILNQSNVNYLGHTAKIKKGSVGGPTVDKDGAVVGMNLSGKAEDGSYVSLSVNEIKKLLDNCGIIYQESGLVSISKEDIADARETGKELDISLLDDYILNYSLLEKSSYTPESYQILEAALLNAREVKADKNATQEEVDTAVEQLGQAKAGLVAAKKINWPFIIAIGVIVSVVIAGLVLYILKLKGVLFQKPEPEPIVTLSQMKGAVPQTSPSQRIVKPEPEIVIPKPRGSGSCNETTVLGVESQDEGTVVLRNSGSLQSAYLIRSSNKEKIWIDAQEFLVGKDKNRVNYCIGDNPSISRCHARIRRQGAEYYLSDMKSTNFTFLNSRVLEVGEEVALADGDMIRFSNEEFIFYSV